MVFPKNFAISSSLKGNDDCYFYFYSSCMKGDECPFRHCKQALGTETVCTLWEEGRCFRANCKFRHMKSSVNRSQISCYWENQPGGCRKPHCVFFHRKLKNGGLSSDENQSLILPVSSGKISPVPSSLPELKIISTPLTNTSRSDKSFDETDEGIHSPVEPFVLSIGENEESDSESVSSTPVKSNESKLTNPINDKNNLAKLSDKTAAKSLDFGIKSLEQIRLEKIHKESADIYKTDDLPDNGIENFFHDVKQNSALPSESVFSYPEYKVPSLEDYKLQRCLEADVKYPLTSDFVPLQTVSTMDVEQIDPNKELALASLKHDNDLRSILNSAKKKSPVTNFLKDEPAKKLVNYKKKINASDNEPPKKLVNYKRNNNSSDSPLDFKIKTLDEIRKEKELKKNTNSVENGSCMINNQSCVVYQNHFTNKVQSITIKKLKINRRSEDSTTDSAKKVKRRGDSLDGTGAKMLKLDLYVPSVQQNDLSDQVQTKSDVEKTSKEPCLQNTEDSCLETSYFSKADEPSTMKVIKQSEETSDQVVGSSDCKDESDCQNASLNSSCSPVESSLLIVEADSSSKIDIDNESAKESIENISVNSRTSAAASENSVNRLLSIDELDHFLKDTDVNMDDLDETVDAGEDDIMLKINELLDS